MKSSWKLREKVDFDLFCTTSNSKVKNVFNGLDLGHIEYTFISLALLETSH